MQLNLARDDTNYEYINVGTGMSASAAGRGWSPLDMSSSQKRAPTRPGNVGGVPCLLKFIDAVQLPLLPNPVKYFLLPFLDINQQARILSKVRLIQHLGQFIAKVILQCRLEAVEAKGVC